MFPDSIAALVQSLLNLRLGFLYCPLEKIPLLGSLPILGELLKSRRFQNQDTELWVAVTAVRWNPEEQNQNIYSYSNQMLEEKFNESKKITHGSLMD